MSLGETLRKARLQKKLTPSQVAAATRMKVQTVEAIEREDFSRIAAPIYGKGFIKLYAEEVGISADPLIEEYMERFVRAKRPSLVSAEAPAPSEPQQVTVREESSEKTTPVRRPEAGDTHPGASEEMDLFASERKKKPSMKPAGINIPTSRGVPQIDLSRLKTAMTKAGAASATIGKKAGKMIGAAAKKGTGRLRNLDIQFPRIPVPRLHLKGIRLKSLPVLLGIALALVFVVSALTKCVGTTSRPLDASAESGEKELRMAVEPPAPYLD